MMRCHESLRQLLGSRWEPPYTLALTFWSMERWECSSNNRYKGPFHLSSEWLYLVADYVFLRCICSIKWLGLYGWHTLYQLYQTIIQHLLNVRTGIAVLESRCHRRFPLLCYNFELVLLLHRVRHSPLSSYWWSSCLPAFHKTQASYLRANYPSCPRGIDDFKAWREYWFPQCLDLLGTSLSWRILRWKY